MNSLYGTRVAVLAGDYLFAQSSWHLAQLDNLEVGSLPPQHPACCAAATQHASCACSTSPPCHLLSCFRQQPDISGRLQPLCSAVQVIKLISQVIADFADGEIGQQARHYDTTLTIPEYMDKSFYKTATLIAASCKSAAVFSGLSQQDKDSMFEYGRHLGLAFQVVDDILDFTQTSEQLGKPQVCGHARSRTAPSPWH